MLVDQGDDDDAGSTLVAALDNLPAATAGWEQTLTTTKPRPAAKSHASPDESRRRRLTECERVEELLVHGSRLPTLLVVRSFVVSNSISLGKRFRYLKKSLKYPDGRLVWRTIPFQRELRQPSKAMSWRTERTARR